jgi:hypothetical protein
MSETKLEETLHSFISTTGKSKIAVVIPLFGYWSDTSQQLNEETLRIVMDRMVSNIHQTYYIFVADDQRLTKKVGDVLLGIAKGGNFKGVSAKAGSSYSEYLRLGISCALEDTDAQYVLCVNPWIMLQYNGIDILVDRVNREDAKIVSGLDVNGIIAAAQFNEHKFNLPREFKGIDANFFGMKRYVAEMIGFDEQYKTHYFLGRDIWQTLFTKGFESIISEKAPIFTFKVDWTEFEDQSSFDADAQHFLSKWHFNADIKYE